MVNKKEICPECKRKLRTKCFIFNRLRKTKICKQCDKRIGSNIFYVPYKKKADFISNYSFSEQEKYKLYRKFISEGLSGEQAWRKVYAHIKLLKLQKMKTRYSDKQRKRYFAIKAKEKAAQQKQFVEGLK